jgi:hypothetical protein
VALLQQPSLPVSVRLPSDADLQRMDRSGALWTPDSTTPGLKCPVCLGTGEYQWFDARQPVLTSSSKRMIERWACSCADQFILHRFLMNAGLGLAEMRLGWDDMVHLPPALGEFLLTYIDSSESWVSNGVGGLLWGPHGTGKSSFGHLLLRRLMISGYSGYFIRYKAYLETWRSLNYSNRANQEDRRWFDRHVVNAQVLVLDDLGQEHLGVKTKLLLEEGGGEYGTDAGSRLEDLLRARNSAGRPTIITTNLDPDAIGIRYGRSVVEMLRERSLECHVPGENFRDAYKERMLDELRQGLSRPIVMG